MYLAAPDNMMAAAVDHTAVAADIVAVAVAADSQELSLAVMILGRRINIEDQSFSHCILADVIKTAVLIVSFVL